MLTSKSEVYFWRHEFDVPFPALKLELVGSQAISPAAAITGSEAASATIIALLDVSEVGESHINPINKMIEMKYLN